MFNDIREKILIRRHARQALVPLSIQEVDKLLEVIDHYTESITHYRQVLASDQRTEHFSNELTEILEHAVFINQRIINQKRKEEEHNGDNY